MRLRYDNQSPPSPQRPADFLSEPVNCSSDAVLSGAMSDKGDGLLLAARSRCMASGMEPDHSSHRRRSAAVEGARVP